MTRAEIRRPLEDMIGEIVEGLSTLQAFDRETGQLTGVRLTDIELALPVEARVLDGPAGLVVHADMPSLRTRTDFDLPLQRVVLHLTAAPTGAER
jgi:hypothetical protein